MKATQLPEGYTIVAMNSLYYPSTIEVTGTRFFTRNGRTVSYSRRANAVAFILKQALSNSTLATTDREAK